MPERDRTGFGSGHFNILLAKFCISTSCSDGNLTNLYPSGQIMEGKIRLNFTLTTLHWHSQSDASDTFVTKEAFNSSFYLHLHTLILINPPDNTAAVMI